ncbi:hypothetical protein B0T21DRAFT_380909 [Apiosordaria backusii]|uniref:Uncharacterized protein n=1 Tax=Apiosordaria backusii TaxID=314023 RepID=A0AA40ESR5_9PEZI|nr:hypothetical protein B0T21DRAFT_380909 [Apiosordaria backusii]
MGVIPLQNESSDRKKTRDHSSGACGPESRGTSCHQSQHGIDQKILPPPHAILRAYQNQTSTISTQSLPAPPLETTQITRETNALFNTNGVTIAVGLDAIFGLALVVFLSGVIYQWKRGQRLRTEQEERDRVADGVEVTPAVSVSKESSQVSSEMSGTGVKVVEEQLGDEKGGSSKGQVN